jgi:hypothetical protein
VKKAKAADGKAFQGIQKLSVSLDFYGEKIDVGTLAWSKDERRAYFEYHPDFAAKHLNLSPFKLPVGEGASTAFTVRRAARPVQRQPARRLGPAAARSSPAEARIRLQASHSPRPSGIFRPGRYGSVALRSGQFPSQNRR